MTMKSCTNQYHGSGFEYFVNEDLNRWIPIQRYSGAFRRAPLAGRGNGRIAFTLTISAELNAPDQVLFPSRGDGRY